MKELREKGFWIVYGCLFLMIILPRIHSTPISLPEAAHNTVGDFPVLEQADDGYVNQIEEKPVISRRPFTHHPIESRGLHETKNYNFPSVVSCDVFNFSSS